jgi:hypothetical protein
MYRYYFLWVNVTLALFGNGRRISVSGGLGEPAKGCDPPNRMRKIYREIRHLRYARTRRITFVTLSMGEAFGKLCVMMNFLKKHYNRTGSWRLKMSR